MGRRGRGGGPGWRGGRAGAFDDFSWYAQDSLLDLFQTKAWMRILCAGVLLFLVALAVPGAHLPSSHWFAQALGAQGAAPAASALWFVFFASALSLAMVLAGFGTLGLFWPVLALGALFGAGLGRFAQPWLGDAQPVPALLALARGRRLLGHAARSPDRGSGRRARADPRARRTSAVPVCCVTRPGGAKSLAAVRATRAGRSRGARTRPRRRSVVRSALGDSRARGDGH